MLPEVTYDQPVRVEWKLMADIRVGEPTVRNVDLAKRIGVNPNTITRWLLDPQYQRYENWILNKNYESLPAAVREEIKDVQERLSEGSSEMLDRLYGIIQTVGDPKLEAELCQDWLDRAGHAPQRKVAGSGRTTFVITEEAARVFMRREAEAGLAPVEGEVVSTDA